MANVTVYIPVEQTNNCLIFKLFQQIDTTLFSRLNLFTKSLLVTSNEPRLLGYLKNKVGIKLQCMGYKDYEYPVLKTTRNNYLTHEWIDTSINLGVFFVRNGDSLFSFHETWSTKFQSWLTFSDMFEVNIDIKDFTKLQGNMYKEINKAVRKSNSSSELKVKLENIYSRYIDLTHKKGNETGVNISDLLFVVQNLKGNKNSIVNG